jgi:hypothetical protein
VADGLGVDESTKSGLGLEIIPMGVGVEDSSLVQAPSKPSIRIRIRNFFIQELYSDHLLLITGCAKLVLWLKIPC